MKRRESRCSAARLPRGRSRRAQQAPHMSLSPLDSRIALA